MSLIGIYCYIKFAFLVNLQFDYATLVLLYFFFLLKKKKKNLRERQSGEDYYCKMLSIFFMVVPLKKACFPDLGMIVKLRREKKKKFLLNRRQFQGCTNK